MKTKDWVDGASHSVADSRSQDQVPARIIPMAHFHVE